MHRKTSTRMFNPAQFAIVKMWEQPEYLSTEKYLPLVNKLIPYCLIKDFQTWLSENSKVQKSICHLLKNKTKLTNCVYIFFKV